MTIERQECPVDDCDTHWDREVGIDAPPPRGDWQSGDTIKSYAARTSLDLAREREAQLRAHLESHDVVDFARTISRLRGVVDARPNNKTATKPRTMNDVLRGLALFDAAEDDERLRNGLALVREMEQEFGPVSDEDMAEVRRAWPRD